MAKVDMATYFEKGARFISPERERVILRDIESSTGFKALKELHRANVYDKSKVKDVIYKGAYEGREAVLKVQGVRPAEEESTIIEAFNRQNMSSLIRAPEIYLKRRWEPQAGYGFFIMEYVDAPRIFEKPFASAAERRDFARFYQELKTKALTRPFTAAKKPKSLMASNFDSVDYWRRVCEDVGRLKLQDYSGYVMRYYPIFARHADGIPLEFTHTHLYPDHILKPREGEYVLVDHLNQWQYAPKWYDLTMNVWNCWMEIRDNSYTLDQLVRFVEDWKRAYETIPLVRKDEDFDRLFYVSMINRSIGTLTADLGGAPRWGEPEGRKYLRHMVRLHQGLFDYFAGRLEEFAQA